MNGLRSVTLPYLFQIMSSYLLLRNNKESGPFTIEEIKGMPLKAYDLVWVVGKSAAWRYPGEIQELIAFAPPLPEQPPSPFFKKTSSDSSIIESNVSKKAGPIQQLQQPTRRASAPRSVYVNLPSEKKELPTFVDRAIFDQSILPASEMEPKYDFSDIYKKQDSRAVRFSAKILWISTITLLFGAGILTGFFISDRRNFYSLRTNSSHFLSPNHPAFVNKTKENRGPIATFTAPANVEPTFSEDASKKTAILAKKITGIGSKKSIKNASLFKDSAIVKSTSPGTLKLIDSSLMQNTIPKNEILYQRIKAHPENYINLVTGRFTTGVFGGISSFPVIVTNNAPVMMDMVIVNIDYIQNNEKVFKTESLSFTELEPGETVTIKAPKSPRGVKIRTRLHLVNSRQLDLIYTN